MSFIECPYRQNNLSDTKPDGIKLMRPWMKRLGVVITTMASPASFALCCYETSWRNVSIFNVALMVIGFYYLPVIVYCVIDGCSLNQKNVMMFAWGPIVFPALGITRLIRWIMDGE